MKHLIIQEMFVLYVPGHFLYLYIMLGGFIYIYIYILNLFWTFAGFILQSLEKITPHFDDHMYANPDADVEKNTPEKIKPYKVHKNNILGMFLKGIVGGYMYF